MEVSIRDIRIRCPRHANPGDGWSPVLSNWRTSFDSETDRLCVHVENPMTGQVEVVDITDAVKEAAQRLTSKR